MQRQTNLIGQQIQRIMDSGKMIEGRQFADGRGQFFLIEVNNEVDLLQLLNRGILDSCYVKSHPILSFKELFDFFEKNPPK